MGDYTAAEIDKRVRVFMVVGASLLLLTGVTVAAAYWFDLPLAAAVTLALIIAGFKGSLVAGFFMHLISERKMIYGVLVLTVAFFLVLLFVPFFTIMDKVG